MTDKLKTLFVFIMGIAIMYATLTIIPHSHDVEEHGIHNETHTH